MFRDILVPNPLDSDQQYNRFYHYDLSGMEIGDLFDELYAIRPRLWLLKSDRSARILSLYEQRQRIKWYRERISSIEAELRKRQYKPQRITGQLKPKLAEGVIL